MDRSRPPDLEALLRLVPDSAKSRGRFLRVLREIAGLSQRAVERSLGLAPSYLSALETAKRRMGDGMASRLLDHYKADEETVILLSVLLGHRQLPDALHCLKRAGETASS